MKVEGGGTFGEEGDLLEFQGVAGGGAGTFQQEAE